MFHSMNNNPSVEEIKIEHHPDHWKSTLLGEDFWKDAEAFNQPTQENIKAEHDQLLYTKCPFNLGPEQGHHTGISDEAIQKQDKQQPRPRRFSMNDALSFNAVTLSPSSSGRSSRFGRRSGSRSPSPSVSSDNRVSNSALRSALNMAGGNTNSGNKKDDDIETMLSARGPQEPGTPARPLMFFRGGASWNCLPRDMQAIGIDLFWPVKQDQEHDREILPVKELWPLCQFRRLRVLKLTGMLQSYQKYIWQAAWLNMELEELELGMAIGPRIRRNFPGNWPCIKGGWTLKEDSYGEPVYYGHMGTGSLDRSIGMGEYLDKTAIEKPKSARWPLDAPSTVSLSNS